jgi:hypothetical protein
MKTTETNVSGPATPAVIDRVRDWQLFHPQVTKHIIHYTLPQYHNPDGDDQLATFTAQDCVKQIQRYANRCGRNSRGPTESLRDMLKICHYAQCAYDKLKAELGVGDVY